MDLQETKLSIELAEVKVTTNNTLARVNEIADRLSSALSDHETRLRILERTTDQLNPPLRSRQIDQLLEWQSNWRGRLAGVLAAAGFVSAVISLAIQALNLKIHT